MRRRELISAAKPLPYARKLAYLKSSGTQYIESGVFAGWKDYIEFSLRGYLEINYNGERALLGSKMPNGSNAWATLFAASESNNISTWCGSGTGGQEYAALNKNTLNDIFVRYYYGQGIILRVNGRVYGASAQNVANFPNAQFALMKDGVGSASYMSYTGGVWLGETKIIKDGVLEKSFIPVMSYEGNPEMYDEVSGTFAKRHGDFLYGELDGGGYKCIRSRFSRSYRRSRAYRARLQWKEAA